MHKIFKHRKLSHIPSLGETHIKLQWYNIFPSLFSFSCFYNATFFHSGYVIKPLQPCSTICRAPPFTRNLFHTKTFQVIFVETFWPLKYSSHFPHRCIKTRHNSVF